MPILRHTLLFRVNRQTSHAKDPKSYCQSRMLRKNPNCAVFHHKTFHSQPIPRARPMFHSIFPTLGYSSELTVCEQSTIFLPPPYCGIEAILSPATFRPLHIREIGYSSNSHKNSIWRSIATWDAVMKVRNVYGLPLVSQLCCLYAVSRTV